MHPAVGFLYFAAVISLSMFLRNPMCIIISAGGAFAYLALTQERKKALKALVLAVPVILTATFINALFSHNGATIITYLPWGSPLTAEALFYGLCSGGLLICVMMWFSNFNGVMTSDKITYLFGKAFPSLSLVFSMTLRFVPLFFHQAKKISDAQKCIGRGVSEQGKKSFSERAKSGLSILSCLVTWSLENSIETADSMKSRGYGLTGRTDFSIFRFTARDAAAGTAVILCTAYILFGCVRGAFYFRYYPSLKSADFTVYNASVFAAYSFLCFLPAAIEFWEERKWKAIKSKI